VKLFCRCEILENIASGAIMFVSENSEKSRRVTEMASGLWGRLYSFQHFPQLLMPQFSYTDAWMRTSKPVTDVQVKKSAHTRHLSERNEM
jgi:hypothetical protein